MKACNRSFRVEIKANEIHLVKYDANSQIYGLQLVLQVCSRKDPLMSRSCALLRRKQNATLAAAAAASCSEDAAH